MYSIVLLWLVNGDRIIQAITPITDLCDLSDFSLLKVPLLRWSEDNESEEAPAGMSRI